MKRAFRGAAVAAFGLSLAVIGGGSAAGAPAPEALRIKADGAMAALTSGGCADRPAAFEPVVADAGFAARDPDMRAALLGGAAVCAASGGDAEAAYSYARRGSEEPAADGANWAVRLTLALAVDRPEDAAQSFRVLASRFPAALRELDADAVAAVYARASNDAERLTLIETLRRAEWRSADPVDNGDALRLEHVRLLVSAGRTADAQREAAAITDPVQLLAFTVDSRLSPARPEVPDLQAAARAALGRVALTATAAPDRLSGAVALAGLHLQLGEPEIALRVLDAAFERRRKLGEAAYVDTAAQLPVARDLRAQALFALGRNDDALAELSAAAARSDVQDVARIISLAGGLTYAGRAEQALSALDATAEADLDGEGRAWWLAARACALAEAGRAPEARAAADAVEGAAPRLWAAVTHARLCTGGMDAAAELYARRLADPQARTAALLALQPYRQPAKATSRWGAERRTQLEALRARPDVQAALAKAGGRLAPASLADIHGRL